MHLLLSEAHTDSLVLVLVACIGIIPATLAAYWSRTARNNSVEARDNAAEARENSAGALHEVKANGGMSDPDPTLKDYIKHVGETMAADSRRVDRIETLLESHLKHSKMMDAILAEVFFAVKPETKRDDLERLIS